MKSKINNTSKHPEKPQYWPKNEKWPLTEGEYISSELESLPPVYVISVGDKEIRKVRGENQSSSTKSPRKSPLKKPRKSPRKSHGRRSKYWPKNEKWPLTGGEYVSDELESLPPVFIISVGDKEIRRVRGIDKSKSKKSQKLKKVKKSKNKRSQKKSKKLKKRR